MNVFEQIPVTEVDICEKMSKSDAIDKINGLIVNGKMVKNVLKRWCVEKSGLKPLLSTILYHTTFLKKESNWYERMYCFYNGLIAYPSCSFCGSDVTGFDGSFTNGHYRKYCGRSCSRKDNNPLNGKSDAEKKEVYKKIQKKRLGWKPSAEQIQHITDAIRNPIVREKRRKTCLERYGVENPGVLGGFWSKEATLYIKTFLKEKNIDEKRTYFHGGGYNNKEFWQIIDGHFACYDLVVFYTVDAAKTKDMTQIELVLEYHGPWHFTQDESIKYAMEPSTPYKTETKTVIDSYNLDELKKKHMKKYTGQYFVVWSKGIKKSRGYLSKTAKPQ